MKISVKLKKIIVPLLFVLLVILVILLLLKTQQRIVRLDEQLNNTSSK